ncbi:ABC transporter ATP-binding protein [Cumulibacter soli]|uniref:ABC transporter ATP-binding protein n=1 Tax=Cumulibacter soli TaxID=2546344 RepID=UPI00106830D2|nr:ABC transporter ATP-binding protein [Cumulibacter soli]
MTTDRDVETDLDFTREEPEQDLGAAIEVNDVSKKFRVFADRKTNLKEIFTSRRRTSSGDVFWALHDVSFTIPRGKTFGLIGHNGSGKSTLLKLIAGIHRTTTGSIVSHGRISAMLELGAGFHPELTGRENIYLNGSILGMNRKQIDAAIESIIDFSSLREFIDTPVKVYSSGMYVRLGFAIAVNLDPEILIIDEVIAVGDEEFQRKCFEHLYKLRQRGVTIVVVSHSLGIVADLCDEVAWLDKGRLMGVGPARELIDKYLGVVNERETAALEEQDATGADTEGLQDMGSHRRGSGEIRVTSFETRDANGEICPFIKTGEPCELRINFKAEEPLENLTFGLGLLHESGASLAGPNSGYEGAISVAAGAGFVSFRMDAVPMQPGNYAISTAIVDKGHTYDYLDQAFDIRVRSAHAVTEPGLIVLSGSWTVG